MCARGIILCTDMEQTSQHTALDPHLHDLQEGTEATPAQTTAQR